MGGVALVLATPEVVRQLSQVRYPVTARPPVHEGFGHCAWELGVVANSPSRRRSASPRAATWYAADRSSRPPLWREIVHDVILRAMTERRECIRLVVIMAVAVAATAGVVVVVAMAVPPSCLAAGAAALGLLARRPPRRR
jgi:hypothetical protein